MKQHLTINQLAAQIMAEKRDRADYLADTRQLTMRDNATLEANGIGQFGVNPVAHQQIAARLGIPLAYYDRMREEAPHLLANNVNIWLHREPETRLLRTLRGNVRAFLSDRYRPLDNASLLAHVLPVLADIPEARVESSALTESRLYLKVVAPRVEGEVKKGDVVQAGVLITNSEVGKGALSVQPLVFRLVCLNGLVIPDSRVRANHIGRRLDQESLDVYADDTLRADDQAVMLKLRDTVRAAVDQAVFAKRLDTMRGAAESDKLTAPVKAIEKLGDKFGLLQSETDAVLTRLIEGGDLSQWGVLNAVTRAAQDVESYDRSTELEAVGGRILTLSPSQWREVAQAA